MLFWIEQHPGLAAWVQTVGVLLAIGFTYYVSSGAHRRRAAVTTDRTIAAALRIAGALTSITRTIDGVQVALPKPQDATVEGLGAYCARLREAIAFDKHRLDIAAQDVEYLPHEDGRAVMQVIYAAENFEYRVRRLLEILPKEPRQAIVQFLLIEERLTGLRADIAVATLKIGRHLRKPSERR